MGRESKNGKKKWGIKMEELATMVERAQLEKIQFNKKSKKSGKLSKKEYVASLVPSEEAEDKPHTNAGRHYVDESEHISPAHKSSEKGKGKAKNKGKGRKHDVSSSCPDSKLGFFSSNKGRSISFTGGPNFSYSQFNYTYTLEDNCGHIRFSSTTTTTATTATTTTTTTTATSTFLDSFVAPQHERTNEDSLPSSPYSTYAPTMYHKATTGLGYEEGFSENEEATSDIEQEEYYQQRRLRFEDSSDDDDDDDDEDDINAASRDDDGNELSHGSATSDSDSQHSSNQSSSSETQSDASDSEEGSGDDNDNDNATGGYDPDIFIPVSSLGFAHPDDELSANVLNEAYEKGIREMESDKSDDESSAYSKRKRQQRKERERKLQETILGVLPDMLVLPDYPPTNTSRSRNNNINNNRNNDNKNSFHTPQQNRQRGTEYEGPHSWPKKSHVPKSPKQRHDDDSRKGKAHTKSRDKKKVQLKSKYVKYYASDFGTATATRGWVEGGTVKDDDLLHKFAEISEPTVVHVHKVTIQVEPTRTLEGVQEYDIESNECESRVESATSTFSSHYDCEDSVHSKSPKYKRSTSKRGATADMGADDSVLESTDMTPKELKIYEAILAGNYRSVDFSKKEKNKDKSKRYPLFDVAELARLMEECNEFVQDSRKSMALYPMTKQQRIQVYSLATLYNLKKESIGRGGNRSPVLLKSKKTNIPHNRVLAQFIRDCVESPTSLKSLYLDLDENGLPPRAVQIATKLAREGEREGVMGGRERARFVGENARPVGVDNIGNRMLRGMGWSGGGLGANGEGILEPIAQQMKFSRSGLG